MSTPIRRGAISCLLLLCLSAGCEDSPPPTDRQSPGLSEPMSQTSPDSKRLVSADVWDAKNNPWTRFEAGSWVVFELPGKVQERHLLQRTADGQLTVVIQVRPPGSAGEDWGVELLRQPIVADAWPEMARLRGGASVSRQTKKIQGFALELQVVQSANRTIWLSSHVPGGVVRVLEKVGKNKPDVVRRRLLAFGGKLLSR